MRKLRFFTITIAVMVTAILSVFVVSCMKDNNTELKDTKENVSLNKNEDPINLVDYPFLRYYCQFANGEESGLLFDDYGVLIPANEDAHLQMLSTLSPNVKLRLDKKIVAKHFKSLIKDFHDTNDYLITCFEIYYIDGAELCRIEYVVNQDYSDPQSTIYYLSVVPEDRDVVIVMNVKCNGKCDSQDEKCVEKVYQDGHAECGCQSDDCSITCTIIYQNEQ